MQWISLRLLSGFLSLSSSFSPERVVAETQQEQTPHYTIAVASLAPWDLDVFITNADGSDPKPLALYPDFDYSAPSSPDERWIAFTSHHQFEDQAPAWAPLPSIPMTH